MDTAECGANAGVFFDEGDAAIEIVAAEEDVVEHRGRFNGSPGKGRRCKSATGHCHKRTARKHQEPHENFLRSGYARTKCIIQASARELTSSWRAAMTSARGLGPWSPLLRWRTETVPASAS